MKLTDEEIHELIGAQDTEDIPGCIAFARAIERIATQRALEAAAEYLDFEDLRSHATAIRIMAKEVGNG